MIYIVEDDAAIRARGRLATILPDVEAEERTLRAPEAVVTVPAMEALFAACTGWLSPDERKMAKTAAIQIENNFFITNLHPFVNSM